MRHQHKKKAPLPSLNKRRFSRRDAKIIGNELGVNWSKVRLTEFVKGLNVEREHIGVLDDVKELGKTVLDHLKEMPDYYRRLEEMERKYKADRGKKGRKRSNLVKSAASSRPETWKVALWTEYFRQREP